ncbi:MAG: methyl-accepting chemotaxis protein [Gammaproteobacteria bacterium]
MKNVSVATKLLVPIGASILLVLILYALATFIQTRSGWQGSLDLIVNSFDESLSKEEELLWGIEEESIETVGALLASIAVAPLENQELGVLQRIAGRATQIPGIAFVDFLDPTGVSMVPAAVPRPPSDFLTVTNVFGATGLLGFVEIGADTTGINTAISEARDITASLISAERVRYEDSIRALVINSVVASLVAASVLFLIIQHLSRRIIVQPIRRIIDVLAAMEKQGDYNARVEVVSGDELGQTAVAINTALEFLDDQNQRLNNSVIQLLDATAQLSKRDLTVSIPVTEDVTGPIADALNLLTEETSQVLRRVSGIAEEVARASHSVRSQGDNVSRVAQAERENVKATSIALTRAWETMAQITKLAETCNQTAKHVTATTNTALVSVNSTMEGMLAIRGTIQETGKRIKRLGERSQEINSIVDIINNIAERTHVLALNANMQAATAGEAGRGFAVVAEEVQRLAASSRDSTSQIATLVKNIQIETSDTMATMNRSTAEVAEQSKVAEQAGRQMKETQQSTSTLADAVGQIYVGSMRQAKVSADLLKRAQDIRQSSQQTSKQLEEQNRQTNQLVQFSRDLLESIRVFKLSAKPARSETRRMPPDPGDDDAPQTASDHGRSESGSSPVVTALTG